MHLYFVNTSGLAKVGFILYNKQMSHRTWSILCNYNRMLSISVHNSKVIEIRVATCVGIGVITKHMW